MAGSLLKKLTLILLTVIIIGLVGFLSLPHIIDRVVLPSLLAQTPFSFSRARLSRITPYLIEGSVEIKDGTTPVLSIPRFQMRFTPQSLLQKKIGSLVVDHATLHFQRADGRLALPAFNPQIGAKSTGTEETLFLLPLGVESLILDQCRIVIHDARRPSLFIGVNAQLAPTFNSTGTRQRLEAIDGSFFFSDDVSAAISASATLDNDKLAAKLTIDNGALSLPDGFFAESFILPTFKTMSADLELRLDASSFSLQRYTLAGSLAGLRYVTDQVSISGAEENNTLNFVLSGDAHTHRFQLHPLALDSPVQALVEIDGETSYRDGEAKTSGTATVSWPAEDDPRTATKPLSLAFDGGWSGSGGAHLFLTGEYHSERPLELVGGWSVSGLAGLRISSSLESMDQHMRAALKLESGPLDLQRDFFRVTTSPIELKASLDRSSDQLEARINAALAEISIPEKNLAAKNIALELPFTRLVSPTATAPGSFSIEAVEIEGEHLFSLAATLAQRGSEYTARGALELRHNPDLSLPFKGHLAWPSRTGSVSWELTTDALEPAFFPAFLSLPADLDFSGNLEARGKIAYDGGLTARAQAAIGDVKISLPDKNISLEGLDCAIEFPELPRLQSSPSQRCSVAAIDISRLHFSDGAFTFRVESPQSLFIEKSKLRWCGGTLESGSLRLSTQTSEIDTTLFCSRIGLAELLDQFGFKGTEGEGSLNGKLPIKLSRKRLDFDDGFLFSTPGAGGIVRFSDTDLLRQGVGGVSEAGFLNYALQALEDFSYNWTKLSFNSAGDDLLLILELDGKPSTALPFKFDKKGMLSESDQGPGLQYPIRLDVNFRVPLVELFQVGQSINTIMGSGQ